MFTFLFLAFLAIVALGFVGLVIRAIFWLVFLPIRLIFHLVFGVIGMVFGLFGSILGLIFGVGGSLLGLIIGPLIGLIVIVAALNKWEFGRFD